MMVEKQHSFFFRKNHVSLSRSIYIYVIHYLYVGKYFNNCWKFIAKQIHDFL